MNRAPTLSAMSGKGAKNRAGEVSEAINFAELYPENHNEDFEIIRIARRLLAEALKKYNPKKPIEESALRYIKGLPDEYRNQPQHIFIGFRDNNSSYIVRFDRKADGKPDLELNPVWIRQ